MKGRGNPDAHRDCQCTECVARMALVFALAFALTNSNFSAATRKKRRKSNMKNGAAQAGKNARQTGLRSGA
jgi:hypothetical protein